jgi:hypothetical protein
MRIENHLLKVGGVLISLSITLTQTIAIEVVKADGSLARSLNRTSKVFLDWADFERSAGQNYSFVAKFAAALKPKDVNRPNHPVSYLLFIEIKV